MNKSDDCVELKNIKYQTMLINSNNQNAVEPVLSNIETFLEKEKKYNKTLPWSKLSINIKKQKIEMYVKTYTEKNKLSPSSSKSLHTYLITCLERKKLNRIKDITYNKETGIVENIPCLFFNKTNNKFTLKNTDKKTSTLKSLAPRKFKKKIFKKKKIKLKN